MLGGGGGLQPKSTVLSSLDLMVDREHLAASHPEPEIFTLRERERKWAGEDVPKTRREESREAGPTGPPCGVGSHPNWGDQGPS